MAKRAAAVGASFFAANPLFLKSCSRPTYFAFLREHFPALVEDYKKRFGKADFASAAYSREMAAIVGRACKEYGLRARSTEDMLSRDMGWESIPELRRRPPQGVAEGGQQRLFA